MILSRAAAQAILGGTKTQLRRPRPAGEPAPFTRQRQVVQYERPRTYEDAPAKHADDTTVTETVCHVLIVSQEVAVLGETTEKDARAEGFTAAKGVTALHRFRDSWSAEHDTFDPELEVWAVTFEVERTEGPRFLARGGGYTASRHMAIDDLEAVPPAEITGLGGRHRARVSRETEAKLRRLAARERAARLRDSVNKAGARGIDIRAELEVIDHYLETIRGKVEKP